MSAPVPTAPLGNARSLPQTPVIHGDWGTDFHRDPYEPLGPMGVIAEGEGFTVLDQEGLRLRRFGADGQPKGDVAIPERATLDVARTADGYALLAYHSEPNPGWWVQRIDTQGALWEQRDVPASIEAPSGIFVDGSAILVEDAHDGLVDVETGATFPGRPAGDGRYVRADKRDARAVTLTWSDADGSDARSVALISDRDVGNVVSLDVSGDLAVIGLLLFDETAELEMVDAEIRVVAVDRFGHVRDELSLDVPEAYDANRWLAASGDRVWQLVPTTASLQITRTALEVQ